MTYLGVNELVFLLLLDLSLCNNECSSHDVRSLVAYFVTGELKLPESASW